MKKIRTLIPAQNALLNSPLSPLLGQFGVKVKLFCDEFNKQTNFLKKNILLNVKIIIYNNKTFYFKFFDSPIIFYIYTQLVDNNINVKAIYKIALFKWKKKNLKKKKNLIIIYYNIIKYLKTLYINIKYE